MYRAIRSPFALRLRASFCIPRTVSIFSPLQNISHIQEAYDAVSAVSTELSLGRNDAVILSSTRKIIPMGWVLCKAPWGYQKIYWYSVGLRIRLMTEHSHSLDRCGSVLAKVFKSSKRRPD